MFFPNTILIHATCEHRPDVSALRSVLRPGMCAHVFCTGCGSSFQIDHIRLGEITERTTIADDNYLEICGCRHCDGFPQYEGVVKRKPTHG